MSKLCTDIKQSKKLIELGINVNTSDMYHAPDANVIMAEPYITKAENETFIPAYKGAVPAWSLSALSKLMPLINEYNIEYRPIIERHADDGWACKYYNEETRNTNDLYIRRYGKTPLDAAFEMVCWLLENKKL